MTDPFFHLYDMAYHYDALSILVVKLRRGADPTVVNASIARFDATFRAVVGAAKHDAILMSPEYARMIEVNTWLFDSFEWLHTVGFTAPAEQVKAHALKQDMANGIDRPAAKRALQARWFGAPLTEQKVGYGTLTGVLDASTAASEERAP